MRLTNLSLWALFASVISARFIEQHELDQVAINANNEAEELFLIERAPGQTQWVTEEQKWELKRVRFSVERFELR